MKTVFDNKWFFGTNFTPSTAINQLEMWQEDTFDPETIDRELGYAEKIGMNIMRVFLHDLLWFQDPEGFLSRIDKYLEISESHGIKTMLVLFDDCWNDNAKLGKQPAPIPFTHNSGWLRSPSMAVQSDPEQRAKLEPYVKGILEHFKNDSRIVAWDLQNEPGNGEVGIHDGDYPLRARKSLPMLKDAFTWAKEINPSQPLTAGIWNFDPEFDELNEYSLENSDIVSFHSYAEENKFMEIVDLCEKRANGRPIVCTEYMARTMQNTFKTILPLLKEHNISAINWGLVSGKIQTIYPWSYTEKKKPELPFHDIFEKDGSFLIAEEEKVFAEIKSKQ